jgi:hypothetical protein
LEYNAKTDTNQKQVINFKAMLMHEPELESVDLRQAQLTLSHIDKGQIERYKLSSCKD